MEQIENAPTMQDVSKIIEELYHYAYQQGQLSMVDVTSGRKGLSKSLEEIEAELIKVTANVQEMEDKGGSKIDLSLTQALDSNLTGPEGQNEALHSNLIVPEGHATGFKSPKQVRWNDERDSMLIAAALRGQETLERLSSTDGMGVTLKALKSRLYKLGYIFRDGSWSKKEVA